LGHSLSDMSITLSDARSHVLASLEPLLRDMVNKVLPATAHKALGAMILQELIPVAEGLTNAPLLVRTAPVNREIVAELLARETRLPLQVVAEPTLGEGQAYLKLGATEMNVDLDGVIAAIAAAVAAFFHIECDHKPAGHSHD
ncbi:MAG: flagellar biosynthesis protein, partial [Rhodobacteraceae bacterium]|nr:flagellar biosynthesis protein [Paracoccaceae bacterium]